jgi:Rrf2 family protein
LRKLAANGIVRSYKGIRGGYELARELDQISLMDVIETVEGPYVFSRCISPEFVCSCNQQNCASKMVFKEISDLVTDKLRSVKFSDLVR